MNNGTETNHTPDRIDEEAAEIHARSPNSEEQIEELVEHAKELGCDASFRARRATDPRSDAPIWAPWPVEHVQFWVACDVSSNDILVAGRGWMRSRFSWPYPVVGSRGEF